MVKYYFKEFIEQLEGLQYEFEVSDKLPFELMQEAGYTLYECKTEDDIQCFRKYYAKDE